MIHEHVGLVGVYRIDSIDVTTGRIVETVQKNVVVQGLFDKLFAFLDQAVSLPSVDDINLTHMAIGDGTTAAMRADTSLVNETFRKALTSKSYNQNYFTAKLSIGAAEGNPTGGIIKEIGIFAKATATPGSGRLISRARVDITKNTNIQLLVTWTLTGV